MLLGRRGFFFDIDSENPGGGQSSQGQNQNQNQNQQQQQQEPPNVAPDPFEGLDLDLLDPAVRDRIVAAKTQFASVANQAKQARDFQSRYDQTQAQLHQVQQRISRGELVDPRQTQQQQQQQQPNTLEGDLLEYYIQQGIEPVQAKSFAKMNAGAMEKFGQRFSGQLQQTMAPIAQQVVNSNASAVFDEVMSNDRLGVKDIPEVAQALWDRTQEMAANGQLVNKEVTSNLARIYWAKHVEEHGMPNTQSQPAPYIPNIVNNPAQNQNNQNQNQQTRFTYPGAGNHTRPPQGGQRNNSSADPETQAALAATIEHWQVKPAAFKKK